MTTRRALLALAALPLAPTPRKPCFPSLIRRTEWHRLLQLDLMLWGTDAARDGITKAVVTLAPRHEGLLPARGMVASSGVRFFVRVAEEPLPFDEDWRVEAFCGSLV